MQLTYEQRFKIQEYIDICCEKKIRFRQVDLAYHANTTQPTVSRELKRYKDAIWLIYCAKTAHQFTKQKRSEVNKELHTKIIKWSKLSAYIQEKLVKDHWSPEQIAWDRWLRHPTITHQTIYSYLYKYHSDLIKEYLKRHGKKYNYWKCRTKNKIPDRVSIHDRPAEVEEKKRLGDFEGDTIVWSNTWDRIVTCNDRKSGMLFADIILQQNNQSLAIATSVAMTMQLRDVSKEKLKTITLDNWVEFFDHKYIQEQLGIQTYFADPYSSWQRWANENTNGLLRYFFPKWTDFRTIDLNYFKHIVQLINNRPRKRLWRKTPSEVFYA